MKYTSDADHREVEDLQALMRQFEKMDEIEGDLLEDFVLSATEVCFSDLSPYLPCWPERGASPDP